MNDSIEIFSIYKDKENNYLNVFCTYSRPKMSMAICEFYCLN